MAVYPEALLYKSVDCTLFGVSGAFSGLSLHCDVWSLFLSTSVPLWCIKTHSEPGKTCRTEVKLERAMWLGRQREGKQRAGKPHSNSNMEMGKANQIFEPAGNREKNSKRK